MNRVLLILFIVLTIAAHGMGQNGPQPPIVFTADSISNGTITESKIADGAVTPNKIGAGYNLLTDTEKTQALVGSASVDFVAKNISTKSIASPYVLATPDDTTPSVAGISFLYITDYTTSASITALDGAISGQRVIVFINNLSGVNITFPKANFELSVDADFVVAGGTRGLIEFIELGGFWLEVSRTQTLY